MKRALLILAAIPFLMAAQQQPSVIDRAYGFDNAVGRLFSLPYDNPAVFQYRDSLSLSDISIGYTGYKENKAVALQRGDGKHCFSAQAKAYIKHGTSTIWGCARYDNGKQTNVRWNESADADIIYPYFTADSVGGDFKMERYAFAGGYADRRGALSYGGTISYVAGLYYRNVDPRPRNVTGALDIALGAGCSVMDHIIAGSFRFRKYKQTNEIEFVSEMGKSKVYHLTGLGNHYARFAGDGEDAYFDGYRYGIGADIYPVKNNGVVASVDISRFTFKKVLTGLNKLPLCNAWHNEINAEAGWKGNDFGAAAAFKAYRRHGIENLFGDASSGIYPKIGEIEMYADNFYSLTLKGTCNWHLGSKSDLTFIPAAGYNHRSTIYADPASQRLTNSMDAKINVEYRSQLSCGWLLKANAGYAANAPVKCELILPEVNTLADIERRDFSIAEKSSSHVSADIEALKAVTSRYALGVSISYSHCSFTRGIHSNYLNASIKFIF